MSNISLKRIEQPLKIGITGNIGSGKSWVCSVFKILGIPVFEADMAAKDLYYSDESLKKEMVRLFGENIYTPDGHLNKDKLSNLFKDRMLLQEVNNLIHPLVHRAFDHWCRNLDGEYVLYEAAILIETGYYRKLDATILVTAPEELRIRRILERGNLTPDQVKERISNQWKEEEKMKYAGFIIRNDESMLVVPQILEIDAEIRNMALKKHLRI